MKAQLIESTDEHHWVLLEHKVTELAVLSRALRIRTWSLDGSVEVLLASALALRQSNGDRRMDPAEPDTLAPILGLVGAAVRSLTIRRDGSLELGLGDGRVLAAGPDPRVEAWQVQGGGVLEGMAYRCPAGGGVPWE